MIFEITVHHQEGVGEYFSSYIETVEALTHSDALSMVQRRNPGCLCVGSNSYNSPSDNGGGGLSIGEMGGWIMLMGILFSIWAIIEFWYIAVPIIIISGIALTISWYRQFR